MLPLVKNLVKRKCETMRCRDAAASTFVAKVRGELFAHFHAVALKVTAVWGIDCLACQDEFFVNNLPVVKYSDEHALYFGLHLSLLFRSPRIWTFPLGGSLLCVRIITVNPALVTSDNLVNNVASSHKI
jgi:hypothetical protein